MTTMTCNENHIVLVRTRGQWQGYVASGKDKTERSKRLAEVPEELRAEVKRHVNTMYAIANKRQESRSCTGGLRNEL